eukprot:scaffold76866_cov56-Phaeocystis_antarctica.AAC.3
MSMHGRCHCILQVPPKKKQKQTALQCNYCEHWLTSPGGLVKHELSCKAKPPTAASPAPVPARRPLRRPCLLSPSPRT